MTDRHICAAQDLLRRQFPSVKGLQPPFYEQTNQLGLVWPGGVQIINETNNHWLRFSMMYSPPNCLDVYDSLKSRVSPRVAKQARLILQSSEKSITLRSMHAQRQSGASDCGLFAIATATDLCFGLQPGLTDYEQSSMRQHLQTCFLKGEMKPFPKKDGQCTN